MEKKIRLLILACGANASCHIARTLKESFPGEFYIVGADINPSWLVSAIGYLDEFHTCRPFTAPDYYEEILSLCRERRIDYLLPLFDADQLMFFKGNPDLQGVESLGIPKCLLGIYSSKEHTNNFLESKGFVVPKRYATCEVDRGKDYFIKPKDGFGGKGTRRASGVEIAKMQDDDILIEEICTGPEVTLECFNYHGELYAVARERLEAKSGVCTKARVFQNAQLTEVASRLAREVELPFIFNLQFMKNSSGCLAITDVNLRAAGGMGLSYAAGWDEVTALGKIMLGRKGVCDTVSLQIPEQYVVRSYTDIVTKVVKRRIAFDLDGTLLDSRQRHKVVMDIVLREMGLDVDTSSLLHYKAEEHNNIEWLATKGITGEKAMEINRRWLALIEDSHFLLEDRLYPNVQRILLELSRTCSLYLITARNDRSAAEKQIGDLNVRQYFDKIHIVPSCKDTPSLKAVLLQTEKIDEFHGDTESDMKAAEIAKCRFYASTHGFRSPDFWKEYEVKYSELLK